MFENHMLQPEEVNFAEGAENHNYRLDVSLEDLEELTVGDEQLEKLLDEVLDISFSYTETVFELEKVAIENKTNDASAIIMLGHKRGTIHNDTINKINELAKTMEEKDVSNSWIKRLRPDATGDNRAHYGRFAIALTMYRVANIKSKAEQES